MFTSIALDPREIEARRDAMRWLARQMAWEARLRRLRGSRAQRHEPTTTREAA